MSGSGRKCRALRRRRVRIVDFGDEADLYEPDLRLNAFDVSVGGHTRASEHVAPTVLALIKIRVGAPSSR